MNGKLTVGVGQEIIPLIPAEADLFLGRGGIRIAFQRSGGQVVGARIDAGRVRGLDFKKIG